MKHIIFVEDMKDEQQMQELCSAFEDANVKFELHLQSKTISILERGDMVVAAERILHEKGYKLL